MKLAYEYFVAISAVLLSLVVVVALNTFGVISLTTGSLIFNLTGLGCAVKVMKDFLFKEKN